MVRLVGAPARLTSAPGRLKLAPKVALPFYQSAEWRRLIASIVKARGRRCEDCGRTGCRVFGDHIIELRDGGPALVAGNIRLRCGTCHGQKTERRKRERAGLAGPVQA